MSPAALRSFVMLALVLPGCAGGPYSLDLAVKRNTTGTATTTSFQILDGAKPVERTGTIDTGDNCAIVGQSTGTRTSTRIYEVQEVFNVVGETEAELPLVPGEEEVSKTWASIVRERVRVAANTETVETVQDPSQDPAQYSTATYVDDAITTTAGYYAVAADEFYVRMDLGQLWLDLEDELDYTDVDLLVKDDIGPGDVWPSQNGNSIYVWEATEKLTIGGQNVKAERVAVYGTGSVSPEGEDTAVYDQCFNFGLVQGSDTRPDVAAVDVDAMLLDPGCQGAFEHIRQGTQWWVDGVLVKESGTITYVTVKDYGFEWKEEDEASGTCARVVSPTRDVPEALPFVQYEVTVAVVDTLVTTYVD